MGFEEDPEEGVQGFPSSAPLQINDKDILEGLHLINDNLLLIKEELLEDRERIHELQEIIISDLENEDSIVEELKSLNNKEIEMINLTSLEDSSDLIIEELIETREQLFDDMQKVQEFSYIGIGILLGVFVLYATLQFLLRGDA